MALTSQDRIVATRPHFAITALTRCDSLWLCARTPRIGDKQLSRQGHTLDGPCGGRVAARPPHFADCRFNETIAAVVEPTQVGGIDGNLRSKTRLGMNFLARLATKQARVGVSNLGVCVCPGMTGA